MNGKAPAYDSPEIIALSSYAYWLAMGGLLDQYGMSDEPIPEIDAKTLQTGGKAPDFLCQKPLLRRYLWKNAATLPDAVTRKYRHQSKHRHQSEAHWFTQRTVKLATALMALASKAAMVTLTSHHFGGKRI